MEEREEGWLICVRNRIDTSLRFYDYVIIASGLYTEGKFRPQYPGGILNSFISFYFIIILSYS